MIAIKGKCNNIWAICLAGHLEKDFYEINLVGYLTLTTYKRHRNFQSIDGNLNKTPVCYKLT